MSIKSGDAKILRDVGFTNREINQIANAKAPDGSAQPDIDINDWNDAIFTRKEWIDKLQRTHKNVTGDIYTKGEVDNIIDSFYNTDPDMTVYDWLKREYMRGNTRSGVKMDYITAAKARAERKTNKMYRYGGR